MCIEKVVTRKSGEELHNKSYQSSTAPQRIVLKPNLRCGRQDTTSSDARTSFDHSDKHKENCDGGTYKETCRDEIDSRIQGLPFGCPRTRSHPQRSSPEIDSPLRESPEQRSTTSRPKTKSRVQSVQRAVEGNDPQNGKHGVLRDLRDHSQHTMPQLCDVLAKRYCALHMRNMLMTFRQSSKTQQ